MITQQQLEGYLWGAANLLRGLIDAADFKQYIFPLIFYKRLCDVWDEEFQEGLEMSGDNDEDWAENVYPHRFAIPREHHWNEIRRTHKNVGDKLQAAFINIEAANQELRGIFGTFGDTQWANKQRFSDEKIRDLIEHFSSLTLSIANVPADEMGRGYEYLIKKFADDSGHTAAEFYTNRTVVRLMMMLCDPQPGEAIYDPTCGSGGMLLESLVHLKRQQKEYRNIKLYGQELNIITSSIARINMFLHDVKEFEIVQGDTLEEPKFKAADSLRKFDVILANPPYSIKKWNRKAWEQDAWGRNLYGTPPQGCADYAFQQHVLASLTDKGRSAVLWPHGVLFRDSEAEMRRRMIADDKVLAVIGLGPNLFYNSSMESCILVCVHHKAKHQRGKTIFINAVNDIERVRTMSNLRVEHIEKIYSAFHAFVDVAGFAKVATTEEILGNNGNLSIPLYVLPLKNETDHQIEDLFATLQHNTHTFEKGLKTLFTQLHHAGIR